MAESTQELYLAIYDDAEAARLALDEARRRDEAGELELVASGLIERDASGDTRILDSGREKKRGYGTAGAALGVVAGIIFPPSIVAGAVIGGVAGAVAGKAAEGRGPGFRDRELEALGEAVKPRSFAVVLVARPEDASGIEAINTGARQITHRQLPPDALQGLAAGAS